MLFYAALTVAGVVAAAVVVWIFRSLTVAGKSAYRTLSPSGRNVPQARLAHLNSNLAATPAPWGWGHDKGSRHRGSLDPQRATRESVSRSKSRDWSSLELYARSNEKTARERDATAPSVASVRNVLAGYDMGRETATDTSCWPYRDNLGSDRPSFAEAQENTQVTGVGERPTRPWGW